MKKLLITAIGAAAALGASADLLNAQRFEGMTQGPTDVAALITQASGAYWAELWATNTPPDATNTYEITAYDGKSQVGLTVPVAFAEASDPDNALSVKTTFGKPLTFNAIAGGTATNINAGIYFDSLVKFTVCEDTPTETYDGAKVVMWLQEQYNANQDITGTNLMVKAGFLTVGENGIEVSNAVYECGNPIGGDFADKWHRVTIKAIANITKSELTVPGFAIYIDEAPANTLEAKWDSTFSGAHQLTYTASQLAGALFPSMVQGLNGTAGKDALTSASFDGTGFLNDLVFTDTAPSFAEDPVEPVVPKATIKIGSGDAQEVETLAAAVALANAEASGTDVTITALMGVELDAPLTFTGEANVVLDFAGFVLTNDLGVAAITNNSANLVITNSVGVGGIYCENYDTVDVDAIYNIGTLTIGGGKFWGLIIIDSDGQNPYITGGTFLADVAEEDEWLAPGKTTQETVDGLYEVVDAKYTVKFVYGLHQDNTNVCENLGYGAEMPTPPSGAVVGYTVTWPTLPSTVTADATYTASYSAESYAITYYDGETPLDLAPANYTYGTGVAVLPTTSADTGYQFDGWYDNAGLTGDPVTSIATTATGAKAFYAKFSPIGYTITFVNEIGDDPASTNYTIESGTITLPTATTSNMGVQFDGWTNGTYTTATNIFTPSAANLGNFTLYAAWSSTGSSGFDGGDTTFTIDPGAQATVEAKLPAGKTLSDTVAGSSVTYAQAYALGLVDTSGEVVEVADLDATIEIKDGKVVVGLSSTPLSAYTITLKVYEKASLTAAWPLTPTQTYTLDSATATIGFTPSGSGAGFYKTEVTISNK